MHETGCKPWGANDRRSPYSCQNSGQESGQKMNSGIYQLVNTSNGKRYIGRTVNFTKRKQMHLWRLQSNRHFNKHMQSAWNAGQRFVFEIIEECEVSECNKKEAFWIKHYKTQDSEFGYNICEGGKTTEGFHFTEEQKAKISKANTGRHFSEEVINARRETLKKRLLQDKTFAEELRKKQSEAIKGRKPWNVGIKHTDEFKRKVSEKLKGRIITEEHKNKLKELYSGEKSLSAKLKRKDVIEIRMRFLRGERQRDIKKDYPQITTQTLYDIVRNRRWKSIPNTLEELEVCK